MTAAHERTRCLHRGCVVDSAVYGDDCELLAGDEGGAEGGASLCTRWVDTAYVKKWITDNEARAACHARCIRARSCVPASTVSCLWYRQCGTPPSTLPAAAAPPPPVARSLTPACGCHRRVLHPSTPSSLLLPVPASHSRPHPHHHRVCRERARA